MQFIWYLFSAFIFYLFVISIIFYFMMPEKQIVDITVPV